MLPRRFAELPVEMQNESVSPYFELLSAKRRQLFFRRAAELPLALFLLALLLPLMGFIAAAVCFDSPDAVHTSFCRQPSPKPSRAYRMSNALSDSPILTATLW